MNMTDVATWGQLISSAAVLVTLVYLAIETKQNTAATQANARQTQAVLDQSGLYHVVDYPEVIVNLVKPDPLTDTDQCRITYIWTPILRLREHEWRQYQIGVLDEESWLTHRGVISILFSTDRTRRWWKVMGRRAFSPDFAAMVDSVIESEPLNDCFARACDWDNETTEQQP